MARLNSWRIRHFLKKNYATLHPLDTADILKAMAGCGKYGNSKKAMKLAEKFDRAGYWAQNKDGGRLEIRDNGQKILEFERDAYSEILLSAFANLANRNTELNIDRRDFGVDIRGWRSNGLVEYLRDGKGGIRKAFWKWKAEIYGRIASVLVPAAF